MRMRNTGKDRGLCVWSQIWRQMVFSVADGAAFENNTCGTLEKREEKGKPIDVFKSQEQLEECLREWQHRLFLDGWLILAHVKDKIMNPDGEEVIDAAGYNTFVLNPVRQTSNCSVMKPTKRTIHCSNIAWKRILCMNSCIASMIGLDVRVEPMRVCIWMQPNTRSWKKWRRVSSWQNTVWTTTISCEVRYDNGGSL